MNSNKRRRGSKLGDLIIVFVALIIGVGIISLGFKFAFGNKDNNNNIAQNNENSSNQEDENKAAEIAAKELEEKLKKEEELKNKRVPEWSETAVQDIKDIYGSDEKQVYLTFDDGPSTDVTPLILDILKEEDVTATFFVLGKCVDLYPELLKREYDEGHFIANHGYTHTYSQIYSSVDSVVDEYNRTNEAIQKAINNENYNCHLFRFPGGSSGGPYDSLKAQAKSYLANHEIASTNWNCLTSDAAGNNTVQSQYQGALDTAGNKTSLIVLMHDAAGKKVTPETLKLLIKHYKEEGYEFKNFYDIFTKKEVEETLEENNEEDKTSDESKEKDENKSENKSEDKTENKADNKVQNTSNNNTNSSNNSLKNNNSKK